MERNFTPKEAFYVFQSYWTTAPMMHLYSHSWPVRWGEAGEQKLVKVYSNAAAGLRWLVKLNEGGNTFRAVARRPGHQQRLAQGVGLQRPRHHPGPHQRTTQRYQRDFGGHGNGVLSL